ncbi:MAG: hypothetical protein IJJ23_09885 [Clostridia bacterium]|nr:hypothetical protein [Clostridia bacterium]
MAARSRQAKKLTQKLFARSGGRIRALIALRMCLSTLVIAATAALFQYKIITPYALPIAGSILALVGLMILPPLTNIARENDEGSFSRFSLGRFCVTFLLSLLTGVAVWALLLILSIIDVHWAKLFGWALASPLRILVSCGAVVAFVLGSLWVCGAYSVFSRQLVLYMSDEYGPVQAKSVTGCLKNAVRHAFTPIALVLRFLPWFLLLIVMVCACVLGVALLGYPGELVLRYSSFRVIYAQVLGALLQMQPWMVGLSIVLGGVWMLGLGLIFWPRFEVRRFYLHRLMMRENNII